jgi:WD40 repeat protein
MKAVRRLTAFIVIAAPALLVAASGCVFDVFRLPESAVETDEAIQGDGGVSSLAYSVDGSQLASSHVALFPGEWRVQGLPSPPQIRLWISTAPGYPPKRLLATFAAPAFDWSWPIVSFSPDGKQLFVATQRGLLRWDISAQRLEKWFEGHHVAVSPNGRTVAREFHRRPTIEVVFEDDMSDAKTQEPSTDPKDGPRIELVDLSKGARGTTLSDTAELTPGCFSANGEFLACYGDNGQVCIWHIPSHSWRCQTGHAQVLPRGVFSPDGQSFASQDPQEGPVEIWDTAAGKHRGLLPAFTSLPTGGAVWCLAFSPDGMVLAVGREGGGRRGEIQLWNVRTAHQIAKMTDPSTWGITALCFSPDGTTLASGNGNGAIRFWPVSSSSK